jgi:hypothetical protein
MRGGRRHSRGYIFRHNFDHPVKHAAKSGVDLLFLRQALRSVHCCNAVFSLFSIE